MAKIDTSLIEGYADMSVEEKLSALESYEVDDHAGEIEKLRNSVTKANSEAADWKKKHNALLSAEERTKQETDEHNQAILKELEELRKDKMISGYVNQFIAQGYTEELAQSSAKAMADGDTTTVFANNKLFLAERDKQMTAANMKGTPRPQGSNSDLSASYKAELEKAQAAGDFTQVAYYTRLIAENEAMNK